MTSELISSVDSSVSSVESACDESWPKEDRAECQA